jgi:hypothetical protein
MMDNKQKELLDTYLRKRKIANENGDKYTGSEIIYFLKNKIMTPEELELNFYEGFAINIYYDDINKVLLGYYSVGFIDKEGNPLPRDGTTFMQVGNFIDGLANVQYDDSYWGFIDKEGNAFPKDGNRFMDINNFVDGFARITYKHNKFGFIDKKGNYYDKNKNPIR